MGDVPRRSLLLRRGVFDLLTQEEGIAAQAAPVVRSSRPKETTVTSAANATVESKSRWSRLLRVEWLGQTVASLCWIASVFTYGISSVGDWLQLCAATAWLVANIAAVVTSEVNECSTERELELNTVCANQS